jgi:putative endonuclease
MEIIKFILERYNILKWKMLKYPHLENSSQRGNYGEWMGRVYLRKKGFKIIKKNWRSSKDRRNEIDIICLDLETLVFVEVRARSENSLVNGFDSLNSRKRKALLKSFKSYLNEEKVKNSSYRFDLIEIELPNDAFGKAKLFHHENIAIFNDSLH